MQQLVTVEAAAESLAVSRTTAYALVRSGRLRSVKIGKSRRVAVADIDAFVESLTERATGLDHIPAAA